MFITLSALVLARNRNILPNMEILISYMEKGGTPRLMWTFKNKYFITNANLRLWRER